MGERGGGGAGWGAEDRGRGAGGARNPHVFMGTIVSVSCGSI